MNQRHGVNPVLALLEHLAQSVILYCARLKTKQAGHDLEIVFDPVVNLLEQDFLLPQRGADGLVGDLALRDIPENYREDPAFFELRFGDRGLGGKIDSAFPAAENL